MDDEAVRWCPLLEFRQRDYLRQKEPKKRSLAERMTCARNNIRENYFAKATSGLEHQECKTLQKLHESCSKLRHEVKLLDVDRLRHQVEVRKRMDPDKDYRHEDQLLDNATRRLNTSVASCYLDKGMKFPTRHRSLRDTPIVRKARESLRLHQSHRSIKHRAEIRTSNNLCVKSTPNQLPTISRTFSRNQAQHIPENGHFPSTKHFSSSMPNIGASSSLVAYHRKLTSGQSEEFECPLQIRAPGFDNHMKTTAGTNKIITWASFSSDQLSYSCDSSDNEDSHQPDAVDLKSHIFSERLSTMSDKPTLASSKNTRATPRLLLPRKARDAHHSLLTGELQNEVCRINSKVLAFLKSLPVSNFKVDNSSSYKIFHDNATTPTEAGKTISYLNFHTDQNMSHSHIHRIATDKQTGACTQPKTKDVTVLYGAPRQGQYGWKLTNGTRVQERGRSTYTVNDLVLQALTGIPIKNILGSSVPLHTAFRSMRDTATFKMHKVMEKLAHERTKYQKYEMGELKREMEGPECMESSSWSTPDKKAVT